MNLFILGYWQTKRRRSKKTTTVTETRMPTAIDKQRKRSETRTTAIRRTRRTTMIEKVVGIVVVVV